MRISASEDDPGYEAYVASRIRRQRVMVFVDGDPILNPVTADDHEGIVIVYITDWRGRPAIDVASNAALRRVIAGKVKIVLEDE